MRRQRTFIGPQGMGGMVSLWGANSLVASIQTGTISMGNGVNSGTSAITSVNTANSVVYYSGLLGSKQNDFMDSMLSTVVLTNATTVTVQRVSAGTNTVVVGWVVVEFNPGVIRSIQTGTIAVTTTSNTATITSVNTAKSCIVFNGCRASNGLSDDSFGRVALTNATTVTALRETAAGTCTVAYSAVEFF